MDGEYMKKVLGRKLRRFPTTADVTAEVQRILKHEATVGTSLYRVFYYMSPFAVVHSCIRVGKSAEPPSKS